MKKTISILTLAILAVSCGSDSKTASVDSLVSGNDVAAMNKKREELDKELKTLEAQIKALDSAIVSKDPDRKFPLVSTLTVAPQEFNHYLELQGDIMTDQNVLIYPEMAGTLYRIYVKEGQKVAKGQILASIDDGGLSSQLEQMRTQAALAKTTFERQQRLWEQNIGSEIQYLQAKTQYEAQTSAIKQMESQLGKSSIRAPFSGIIDAIIKDQGTVVAPGPGAEVFRIVNLNQMYVTVEVPESHLPNVTPGKSVEVFIPVLGSSINSKVRQTGNFINPGNRAFSVEIPVPNKDGSIKPNLTAQVKINDYTNPEALLIPQSIVSENADGDQYVYLASKSNNGDTYLANRKVIETGKTQGDYIEVLSGLTKGDQIISEGARSVRDNQEIRVKNTTEVAKK